MVIVLRGQPARPHAVLPALGWALNIANIILCTSAAVSCFLRHCCIFYNHEVLFLVPNTNIKSPRRSFHHTPPTTPLTPPLCDSGRAPSLRACSRWTCAAVWAVCGGAAGCTARRRRRRPPPRTGSGTATRCGTNRSRAAPPCCSDWTPPETPPMTRRTSVSRTVSRGGRETLPSSRHSLCHMRTASLLQSTSVLIRLS